jgi:hypothetical protein
MTAPVPARRTDLARLARLLDAAVRVPGTDFRVGLDALLGLVPGVGDLAGAAMSGYIVLAAVRAGAPATVLVMMLTNVAVDTLGGAVPLVGDLFDAGWRSNTRNVALLERHLAEPTATRAASRVVVVAVVVGLLVLVAAGLTAAVLGVRALLRLAS